MEENMTNNIVEEKTPATKKKTTKSSAAKTDASVDVETLKNENEAYKTEIDSLKAQMAKLMEMMNTQMQTPVIVKDDNPLTKVVTIVHLYERYAGLTTHIQLTNRSFDMSKFGEKRTLDLREAEELVGKCRKLFDKGILVFGKGSEEIAERFGLNTIDVYKYADNQFVQRLNGITVMQLEELYNSVASGIQQFLVEYFKRMYIDKNPSFMDIHKIEVLNRLSDGAMKDILLDYSNSVNR